MPLTPAELAELSEDAIALCQVLLRLVHPRRLQPTKEERKQIAKFARDFALKLLVDVVD